MDIIFGIMCGMGLFLLLIPFLKTHQQSPPPGSDTNTPKVANGGQSKTREKMTHGKGCRHARKKAGDTQKASQPVEIPTKHPLLDPMPQPFWNSDEKLKQLPLSQLLSYLKVLEDIMQQEFSRVYWGMSSVLPESVVAPVWDSRTLSSTVSKTSSFNSIYGPFPALPLAYGPPKSSHAQPLSHQLGTPSLAGMTGVQTLNNIPSSTANRTPSPSKSKTYGTTRPSTEVKVLQSLPTEDQIWQQRLKSGDTTGPNVRNHQAAISQPTHNLPRGTQPTEAMRSAAILPEHAQILQYHEEPQNEDRMTRAGEHHGGPCIRFLASGDQKQPPGHFPANRPGQSENRPGHSQPAQPSLNSESYISQMMASASSGIPLKKSPATFNKHYPIKEGRGTGAKGLPWTPSSTPVKGLDSRNPALRLDQQSYVNSTQDLSFLHLKTQMKLESNIPELPVKHRRRPYLQTLESRDLSLLGVPASSPSQYVYPSPSTSVSKSEYCPKAAVVLDKLHNQDPGGTRVEIVSAVRLPSPLSVHSVSEVQETQRATPLAASHGPYKTHPDAWQSSLSARANAYCLMARNQQSRKIRGTGQGSWKPSTRPGIVRREPWMSENVAPEHPCQSGRVLGPRESVPHSVPKQTYRILEEKKETPPPWNVSLGSGKMPNDQTVNINLRNTEFVETNRNPGHFETCQQHSRGLALEPQVISEVGFNTVQQPHSRLDEILPDPHGTVQHPDTVSLPSPASLPRFRKRSQNSRPSQGLSDVFMRRDRSQQGKDLLATKDKIPASKHTVFHPSEEKRDFMSSRAKSQGDTLGILGTSQAWDLNTSIHLKDTDTPETQAFLDMPGNKQIPAESFLKKIIRYILQYFNLGTKDKEEGDSLKNESPPPCTLQTQEVVKKERIIYKLAADTQSLMNSVVQILVDKLGFNVEDLSSTEWCRVEPLISQLRGSVLPSESLCDLGNSLPRRRKSCGHHTSHKGPNHPFTYNGTGDKQAHRSWDQPQSGVKKEMGFDQLPTFKGNNHPFMGRANETKHQSGMATKTARAPDQIKVKSGMGCCQHSSHEGYTTIHSGTEKLKTDSSQALFKEPVTHIKVQREEWAVASSPVPKRTSIYSCTGELKTRSNQGFLPGEPATPGSP